MGSVTTVPSGPRSSYFASGAETSHMLVSDSSSVQSRTASAKRSNA